MLGGGSLTTEEGEERLRGARLEKEAEEEGTVLLLQGMCVGTGGRREKTRRKKKRQWAPTERDFFHFLESLRGRRGGGDKGGIFLSRPKKNTVGGFSMVERHLLLDYRTICRRYQRSSQVIYWDGRSLRSGELFPPLKTFSA